jgi:hypothetical protein
MVGGAQRRPAETGQWRHKKRRKLNKGSLQTEMHGATRQPARRLVD